MSPTKTKNAAPTEEQKIAAEEQIRLLQTEVDYDTKEYPVEVIVKKYLEGIDEGKNEIFVPDYQRDLAWNDERQSKFIESVIVGLPIPYIFVADVGDDVEEGGRLEIVDGSQRIRTLARFVSNKLTLTGLEKLTKLEGLRFFDLPSSRRRRINRRSLRMIELTEKANETIRRDIFERLNTGSLDLEEMEKRRGIQPGVGLDLIHECAKNALFAKLAPLTAGQVKKRDREELVLRFFTYLDRYEQFTNRVGPFMNSYLKDMNKKDKAELLDLNKVFLAMLAFVGQHFPSGFAKDPKHKKTPRVRFEALSVGTALALVEKQDLVPEDTGDWLESKEFLDLTTSGSSNSRPRVKARIEFVRDQLLAGAKKL